MAVGGAGSALFMEGIRIGEGTGTQSEQVGIMPTAGQLKEIKCSVQVAGHCAGVSIEAFYN